CPDPDNDGDGILDEPDECPNEAEDRDGLGDEDGCPETDFDGDGADDVSDRCPTVPGIALALRPECTGCPTCDEEPPPPEPEPAPPPTYEPSPAPSGPTVFFEVGSHVLRGTERAALFQILEALRSRPGARALVEGHADFRGSEPDNAALSRRRAFQVIQWLVLRGVDRSRLEGAACGEAYPAEPNDTRAGRRANRRVEIRSSGDLRAGCRALRF
ncbi:MAG: OmpA family protein, partial [Myxococcales bacterium]|nr:OmpA family protein [Myxococcales bacterium]